MSSPVCVISVVILPSPFTVTLEPSLFVFSALLSALKRRPLLISSVLALLILVVNSFLASCNWPPFTASLLPAPTVPSATLVIFWLFALRPVGDTYVLPPTVKPLLSILVLPAVTLSKPVNVLANFTFNVPLPSDSTPIFPSDNAPVAPPLTVTVSPNCLLLTVPVSPAKFNPLLIFVLILEMSCLFWAILPALFVIFCLLSAISCLFLSIWVLLVLTLSLTFFNWSSVAPRPDTAAGWSSSQSVFVRPVTWPASPSTVTGCAVPTVILLPKPTVYSLPPAAFVLSVTVTFASFGFTVDALAVPPIAACNWL